MKSWSRYSSARYRWLNLDSQEVEVRIHVVSGLLVATLVLALTSCQPLVIPSILGEEGTVTAIPAQTHQETQEMASKVTAEVILRSPDGTSILDATEGLTDDTIGRYQVSKEVIAEASRKLEALGFEVVQTGPVSITISGDRITFEDVFQTKLQRQSGEAQTGRQAFYQAQEPLQIPEEMASLIAAVSLPIPPEFYP